ncbi:MAG: polymerase sigma-70 factor, subfamily [Actinomycetota bacterium]|nr:polymerase sigma-70 factor, subfamily [Actinomycetota bacterium]
MSHLDADCRLGEELRVGLAALRTAIAMSRDPLTQAPLSRSELAFRALPRPRTTGGGAARAASPVATVTTIAAVGPQPESPDSQAGDAGGAHEPDEAVKSLVARAQAGDPEAFGELYDRYVDLVYRYVYYRVGTSQLAEDLTSETFLRALRRISTFTWQGRDVGAWFVTIARNLIADHYKSGRYRLEMTSDDVSTVGEATQLVSDSPENAVLEAMQNKVLLEAVKQLNAEQQECIVLRFLQGLSVAETAQAMGKNDGAIKALQYRAVRALARLLPEEKLR